MKEDDYIELGIGSKEFAQCYFEDEFCLFHNCGPTDPEQCGKLSCPHCQYKTEKERMEISEDEE
jgi:hypothetical protein